MHELRILAGHPTEEEIAALTVVLVAAVSRAAGAGDEPGHQPVSRWRLSARPSVPGRAAPGAWRASALPAARTVPG